MSSLFDRAYYCGMENDREVYEERKAWEAELEATTPEPKPEDMNNGND